MNMTPRADRRSRRGMLLLLVLGVLTLFLLMGALLMTLAMRARESARAFSKVMSGASARPVIARPVLDEALMVLIRGSQDAETKKVITESLLGDMYGSPPTAVPFVKEAHDAVASDAFLKGYSQNDGDKVVDNDGDGEPDGAWLVNVLPPASGADGGRVTFRVSYRVHDLDGRINVNAHGSPVPLDPNAPVGPANVDGATVLSGTVWSALMSGGTLTRRSGTSSPSQWRPAPLIGTAVQGRFGGGTASTYAVRLDREAPRPARISGAAGHNPFTPGELERVLRTFDADAATLPPRLGAILDDTAQKARLQVTTESWDTAGKTGLAAEGLAAPAFRFDINRPAADDAGKEQYKKDLLETLQLTGVPIDGDATNWVGKVADARAQKEFVSVGELLTIPIGSSDDKKMSLAAKSENNNGRRIFEAVMVPSRFAATIGVDPWREPGRVNVNTCDDDVWKAVCGRDGVARPARPIESLWKLLVETAGGKDDAAACDKVLANRLASIATVRSNVFAVWITVEITDSSSTAAPPSCHRLFAIVDRSIPVSYGEGENRNVRETIRVRRFIE